MAKQKARTEERPGRLQWLRTLSSGLNVGHWAWKAWKWLHERFPPDWLDLWP